ncbi:metallophosphoesterase family protein [Sulfurimonas sp. MAG313]|nr:metallophosphoesterase family protein [Sulfurimonas sp. MAG313]MDF1881093.1 metallophosphoesterase family protein [Sulfurimonas sp. MAG313]
MLKKILKYLFVFLLIAGSLYGFGRLAVVLYGTYSFETRQPYLQKATQDSIVVLWQTPQSEKGCLVYGDTSIKLCEVQSSKYHRLELTGLDPATKYTYQVKSKSLEIDNTSRYFSTLNPNKNLQQHIWVLGDSGKATVAQGEVRDSMLRYLGDRSLDTWLMLGDNAYRSGTQKDFTKGLFNPYEHVLKTQVLWPVIGNHDARRWAFYDIFEFPTQGESGGEASGNESFYSFENGNVHFVMLDSETVSRDKDGDMAQWLERDLSKNTQTWTIVAFHHPPYTKGSHDSDSYYDSRGRMVTMRENIVPILEKYDVDLVLSGHSHVYERSLLSHKHYDYSQSFDKTLHVVQDDLHHYTKCINKVAYAGTIYNVAGSSSENQEGINPFDVKHPMMPFSFFSSGSLLITADKSSLLVEMIMRDGIILDSYDIKKSQAFCK